MQRLLIYSVFIFTLSLFALSGCVKTYTLSPVNPIPVTTPTYTPTSGKMVTTLAGQAGIPRATNGTGTAATFFEPWGGAACSSGNGYVWCGGNQLILEIAA